MKKRWFLTNHMHLFACGGKFLKIMKITVFIVVFASMQTFALDNYAQTKRMDVKIEESGIVAALEKIEAQSEFFFFYNNKVVKLDKIVSVDLKHKTINEILDALFKDTDIEYTINNRQIILSGKETGSSQSQQQKSVSGKVTDRTGASLPGASVVVKGTTTGTITDANGDYTLSNIPGNATLIFSFIGMKKQEVTVGNKSAISVTLAEETVGIDEVVAIGYGTTSKRKTVSAISTIQPEKLQNIPVPTIGDMLAGRTSGVIVATSGGGPIKKPVISIRGGATPLVVIDGIVASITDFQNLNATDIESFSVLKDAEGAAIYGARGGNGIITITTKKGESGKMRINYDYSQSFAQPCILPSTLSSYENALISVEKSNNSGQIPTYSAEILQKYKDQSDPYHYPNTDWKKVSLKKFAPSSRHNLIVNGGNEKTKYFASVSCYDQGTLYKFDTNWLKRYNYRFSLTNNFEKIGLTANVSVFGVLEKTRNPASQYGSGYNVVWGHILNQWGGTIAYNDLGLYSDLGNNALVEIDPKSGYDLQESRNVNGILDLAWAVPGVNGLKIKAINHYRLNNSFRRLWNATADQYSLGSTTPITHTDPTLFASAGTGYSYTNQIYGDYNRVFAKVHSVAATFGYEQTYDFAESIYAQRVGYKLISDQFIAGPTLNSTNGGSASESARAGYIGRLRYDYKTKYFVEGSFRRDGSDWFPEENRWGTFWSGSAGWIASEEAFMKRLNDKNIINFLKLRGSYGTVGLDGSDAGISRFQYMTGYNLVERGYLINNSFVQGFSEGPLVSPDLTWYTQKSRNIGFDFTSLNSNLSGSFDYFYLETTGILASLSGSIYTDPLGIALPTRKSDGQFRREGFEFNLSYKNHFGDLQYEIGGNLTRFDQLWKMNPNEDAAVLRNPYTRTTQQTGYYGIGYHSLGFYTSAEDVLNSPKLVLSKNLVPGDIKYEDTNGDGLIDVSDQRRIGSNSFPRLNYGINLDLRYKAWFLFTLLQGSGNRDAYPGNVIQVTNLYNYQKDYWTPSNRNSSYPRLTTLGNNGSNNVATSDFWLTNARYIRLKSLQLGYNMKQGLLKNLLPFVSEFSIILSGSNLFTISEVFRRFQFDPEAGSFNNYDYPTERTYSLTVRLGF